MSDDKKHECSVRDGRFIEPCDTLEQFIASHAPYAVRGSGFFHLTYTNINTLKPTRSMVGYKTPQKKKGLLINFCPWCGTKIDAPFVEPEDPPKAKP